MHPGAIHVRLISAKFVRGRTLNMKYTQNTLDKIEKILDEAEYVVRYERGTFQSGYCILEDRKVVVLNKFLQTEGRINTLIDILPQLKLDPDGLTPETRKLYLELMSRKAENPS
jgi:hypothetical protein